MKKRSGFAKEFASIIISSTKSGFDMYLGPGGGDLAKFVHIAVVEGDGALRPVLIRPSWMDV
jgi:hypothetical protein